VTQEERRERERKPDEGGVMQPTLAEDGSLKQRRSRQSRTHDCLTAAYKQPRAAHAPAHVRTLGRRPHHQTDEAGKI